MATLKTTKTTVAEDDSAKPAQSFESALTELEGIVAAMEAGQMPLQEALDAYRRGAALLNQCQATLNAAEQQIRILDTGELRDFDAAHELAAPTMANGGKQEG